MNLIPLQTNEENPPRWIRRYLHPGWNFSVYRRGSVSIRAATEAIERDSGADESRQHTRERTCCTRAADSRSDAGCVRTFRRRRAAENRALRSGNESAAGPRADGGFEHEHV